MTMLMDRCAETLPKESIFSIISNSKVFSSTTPFLEQLQHPSCNKIFTQSLVWPDVCHCWTTNQLMAMMMMTAKMTNEDINGPS